MTVLYRCFKLPGYGRKCPDRNTDKCFKCNFCKAELSAEDATRLLNAYGGRNESKRVLDV